MRKLILIILITPSLCFGEGSRSFTASGTERVSPGNVHDITTGDFTISAWFKGTEDAAQGSIVTKKRTISAGTGGYSLYQNATDNISIRIADGLAGSGCSSGRDFDGIWTHATFTWAGNTNTPILYENAVSACTGALTIIGSLTTTFNFTIGNNGLGNEAINGNIAHVSFHNTLLNDWQRREKMFRPDIPVEPPTRNFSQWGVWGQSGSNEKDLFTLNFTGVVTGTSLSGDGPPSVYFGAGLPL